MARHSVDPYLYLSPHTHNFVNILRVIVQSWPSEGHGPVRVKLHGNAFKIIMQPKQLLFADEKIAPRKNPGETGQAYTKCRIRLNDVKSSLITTFTLRHFMFTLLKVGLKKPKMWSLQWEMIKNHFLLELRCNLMKLIEIAKPISVTIT